MKKYKKEDLSSRGLVIRGGKRKVNSINESQGKPNISLCMIVRDEAENLDRCLGSLKGLTDEIIIVDTGSKDNTMEISKSHGAEVYEIAWNDDFSEARNVSLSHASKDWILVLDADEELPPAQHHNLRKLLDDPKYAAYTLRFRSKVGSGPGAHWVVSTHTRLFRNHCGIQYSGKVHEDIRSSVEALGETIGSADIEVLHHGYTEDIYREKSKADRNIQILKKIIAENPSDGLSYFYLGEAFSMKGSYEEAVEAYKKGFAAENLHQVFQALLHQNLATALLHIGQRKESREEAREALLTDSRLTAPHLIAGAAAFEEELDDLAIFHLTGYLDSFAVPEETDAASPVRHEPNRPLAYELLGRACCRTNNFEGAFKWFQEWEKVSGTLPEILVYQAEAFLKKQQIQEAGRLLQKALEINPQFAETHLQMGLLKAAVMDNTAAMEHFHTALSLKPTSFKIRIEIGRLYLSEKRFRQACEILEEVWRLNKNNVQAGRLLVEAYILTGRNSEAKDALETMRSFGRESGEIEYLIGLLAKQEGNTEKAAEAFKKAIHLELQPPEFYYVCGNSLIELQKYREAITAFEKAIVLVPSVKEPYINAGVAFIKLGEYHNAIKKFEQILRLDPDSKQVKKTLAGLYGKIGDIRTAERYLYETTI